MNRGVVAFSLAALFSFSTRGSDFYLKDGDRVVFYGDSITDQRLYTTFTEDYVLTRFPKMDVTFVHSGWGGDRVTGGGGGSIDTRLQRDVIPYHPTVMTIMLAMNDALYRPFDVQVFQTYTNGYQHIINVVKKDLPDLRITVIQPSPYDDVVQAPKFEGGYNEVLIRYGEFVKQLAEKDHLDLADLNTPVVEALKKAKETNPDLARKIIPDRVHPGPGGHLIMSAALLEAWDAPSTVTWTEIDADKKKAVKSERTDVSHIKSEDGGLEWDQQDEALPMPIDMQDPVVALSVHSSDVVEKLDQEVLQVNGLDSGDYKLTIDDSDVGTFSSDDLAKGVNLAVKNTPMMKQAMEVHHLTLRHNDLHFIRWRQIQVPFSHDLPHYQEALDTLDKLEADLVKVQRHAAQPEKHHYVLKKS